MTVYEQISMIRKVLSTHLLAYLALVWLVASFFAGFAGLVLISGDEVTNTRLLIAVALGGAAGAALQASTALMNYIGNRRYLPEWTAYFLIRPLLGAGTALVVYVALRAGFVESQVPASSLNYYGIVGLSALVGLYSGGLLMRLTQLFDVLFSLDSPLGIKTELRQLDRYQGFLVHEQDKIADSNRFILKVWLQTDRPEAKESAEIDIGEGEVVQRVTFRVNIYSEECDVEPSSGELVAGTAVGPPVPLRFVFACPAGIEPSAFLELSQRGRTVAVVPLGRASAS